MSTVRELKKHLESFKDDDVIAFDIWDVTDVEFYCNDMGINLTREQCEGVIHSMEEGKDANIGMNWDLIGYYAEEEVRNET